MAQPRPLEEPVSESRGEERRRDARGTIVCGNDSSSEAKRAAFVAARLARDLNSPAVLVDVEADAPKRTLGLRWPRAGRATRKRKMLRATAEECCFPSETQLRVKRGEPGERLLALAIATQILS
jgi:nucleotide-binding universal stress UspA family protein